MRSTSKHPKLKKNKNRSTNDALFFKVISFEIRKQIIGFPLTRRSNVRMKDIEKYPQYNNIGNQLKMPCTTPRNTRSLSLLQIHGSCRCLSIFILHLRQ